MGARETKEMGKFTRFVENGRVVLVNFGPDAGKLAVVVDVVDSQRCLIVGPSTDVARQMIGYKRLSLTDIKVDIGRGAKAKSVSASWTAADVEGKWASSAWGKTLAARKAKAEADFERFTDMVSHKKAMKATRKALKK